MLLDEIYKRLELTDDCLIKLSDADWKSNSESFHGNARSAGEVLYKEIGILENAERAEEKNSRKHSKKL